MPAFGSEWYRRQMYFDAVRRGDNFFEHHREKYGPQSEFGYKDFVPRFRAEKFDPDAWPQFFRDAGAKYVMPVADHHDGFAMYASRFTKWNSMQMGPKRDIIAELAEAVRAEGMKFGVSSHRAFNWKYYDRRPGYDNVDPTDPVEIDRPIHMNGNWSLGGAQGQALYGGRQSLYHEG